MRGRLGIVAPSTGRRNSSAQITTIDAALLETNSVGRTGSDPVDDEKEKIERQGRSNLKRFVYDLWDILIL